MSVVLMEVIWLLDVDKRIISIATPESISLISMVEKTSVVNRLTNTPGLLRKSLNVAIIASQSWQ